MTKQVQVQSVAIGGGAPISVQSMTNTDTRDAEATVAQIERLQQAGCDIVRLAVFDSRAADAIGTIRQRTTMPLVADVHFDYRLAIAAVENGVDKLRINPGNIGSKERVQAVADCCKRHHIPIRIGVNGGSLDKEMQKRYPSDRPKAMVESALREVRALEEVGFSDIVLSLKCTDVQETVQAYQSMAKLVDYPLHIGITETGPMDKGIIKSSCGIGALLLMGIGDTLRVSLTGDPVDEVRLGKDILRACGFLKDDVEIVSCPTCGRTRCNVFEAVETVNRGVLHHTGYLKIAVMGCAVNGPGEARDADIGVAFGDGNGVLFRKGEIVGHGSYEEILARLIRESNELLGGVCSKNC